MVKIRRFDGEGTITFPSLEDARVYLLGKMIVHYLNTLGEEDVYKLARRAGFDVEVTNEGD